MKTNLPYDRNNNRKLYDNSFHAASMSECTGLIPTAPDDQSEVHSYSDIYDIPLPNFSNRRDKMNNQNNQNSNQKNNQSSNQKNNQSSNQKNNQSCDKKDSDYNN